MNDVVVSAGSPVPATVAGASPMRQAGPAAFVPTQPQKAAIVLSLIEPASAAELLQQFSEATIMQFAKAVSDLRPVPPHLVEAVVNEFLTELGDSSDVRGGIEQVREFLEQFLEADAIDRIVGELHGRNGGSVWSRMADAPVDAGANFLSLEHPQTVSIILARLRPDVAARMLEQLDNEFGQIVVLRMSNAPNLTAAALADLEETIDSEFLSVISRRSAATKPAELLGNLMNNVTGSARDRFLAHLEEKDAAFAQDVVREMFTFADIAERVPPTAVPMVVKAVDEEQLLIALRYARDTENPSFDFIIASLSKRLSERIVEDLDAMDEVREAEGESAGMEMTNLIQQMAKKGEIKLIEPDYD